MDAGQIEVKIIPQNATKANVLIRNLTDKPVELRLPKAFASVPVLAQGMMGGMGGMGGGGMGGMGGGGMGGGGGQAGGGGMGGMGGGGMGGMGGGGMGGMGMGLATYCSRKNAEAHCEDGLLGAREERSQSPHGLQDGSNRTIHR